MNNFLRKLLSIYVFLFLLFLTSTLSFGFSDYVILSDLSNSEEHRVTFLDKDHPISKKVTESLELQPDDLLVVAFDQHRSPINLELQNNSTEILSMIDSELSQPSLQSSINALDLDQLNDYALETGLYQNITEFNHQLLHYSSHPDPTARETRMKVAIWLFILANLGLIVYYLW